MSARTINVVETRLNSASSGTTTATSNGHIHEVIVRFFAGYREGMDGHQAERAELVAVPALPTAAGRTSKPLRVAFTRVGVGPDGALELRTPRTIV